MSLNQSMHKGAFSRAEWCDARQSAASKVLYRLDAAMRRGTEGLSLSIWMSVGEALTVRRHKCNHEINSCQGKQVTDRDTQSLNICNLQGQLKFIKIPRK